jgi:hypothetical protein
LSDPLEEEAEAAKDGIGSSTINLAIDDPLIVEFDHDLGGWKYRYTSSVELLLTSTCRHVRVDASEAARLEVLICIAIEGDGLPLAVENLSERKVIIYFSRVTIHILANVVCGIAVIVCSKVGWISKPDLCVFGAKLEATILYPITELGIDDRDIRFS